jgi:flagellar hook-length control protein FliK
MNQANLDYLFQLTAAGAVNTPVEPTRSSSRLPAFDDHLSRASAPTRPTGIVPGEVDAPEQDRSIWTSGGTAANSIQDPQQTPISAATAATATDNRAHADDRSTNRDESNVRGSTSPIEEASTAEEDESGEHRQDSDTPTGSEATAVNAEGAVAVSIPVVAAAAAASAMAPQLAEGAAADSVAENSKLEQASGTAAIDASAERVADEVAIEAAIEHEPGTGEPSAVESKMVKGAASAKARGADGETGSRSAAPAQEAKAGEGPPAGHRASATATPAGIPTSAITGELQSADGPAQETADNETQAKAEDQPRSGAVGAGRGTPRTEAGESVSAAAAAATNAALPRGETTTSADAAKDLVRSSSGTSAAKGDAVSSLLARPQAGSGRTQVSRRPGGKADLPRIDPARFIGRVAKAFQSAAERGGTLHLRLSPPELGSLRLELTVKEGTMTAVLETETAGARRLLLDHLPALRDRLAEQNIRIERFDVDVRRDGGSQPDGHAARQEQRQQPDQSPPRRQPSAQPRVEEPSTRQAPGPHNLAHNTQLNMLV